MPLPSRLVSRSTEAFRESLLGLESSDDDSVGNLDRDDGGFVSDREGPGHRQRSRKAKSRHLRRYSMSFDRKSPSTQKFSDEVIFVDMLDSAHLAGGNASNKNGSESSREGVKNRLAAFGSDSIRGRWDHRSSGSLSLVRHQDSNEDMSNAFTRFLRRVSSFFSRLCHHEQSEHNNLEWQWKKPPDEDSIFPQGAAVYLALIGWLTFAICSLITFVAGFLDKSIRTLSFEYLLLLRSISIALAFLIPASISTYATGSGVPELKCIVNGSFLPKSLAPDTLLARVVGLTFSLASGLSVGRLGPFMHIAGGIASTLAATDMFHSLYINAKYQIQAISAATAAGVGATLGSPIGGTLLSVELMSSYYFVHWLPMAFYCSMMGFMTAVSILRVDEKPFFLSHAKLVLHDNSLSKLFSFILLGFLCGLVGAALVRFTSSAMYLRAEYFPAKNKISALLLLLAFTWLHTLICYGLGGIMWMSQQAGVTLVFNHPVDDLVPMSGMEKLGLSHEAMMALTLGLFFVVKFVLTGLSLSMPIPAGTFGPIFEIGALLGAACAALVKTLPGTSWIDTRTHALLSTTCTLFLFVSHVAVALMSTCCNFLDPIFHPNCTAGYFQKIVGAAALPTGVLHTISVAVVMLELTGEQMNVIPVMLACLVSYFTSKTLTADLFSTIIKLRQLPFVIGLRESHEVERERWRSEIAGTAASEIMVTDFPYVTKSSTMQQIRGLLDSSPWSICAFLSSEDERYLLGVISRSVIEHSLHVQTFGQSLGRVSQDQKLPMLSSFDPRFGHPHIDPAPLQIEITTPYWKLATYFTMLGVSFVYVVSRGSCKGLVTKGTLIAFNNQQDRLPQLELTEDDGNPSEDCILGKSMKSLPLVDPPTPDPSLKPPVPGETTPLVTSRRLSRASSSRKPQSFRA